MRLFVQAAGGNIGAMISRFRRLLVLAFALSTTVQAGDSARPGSLLVFDDSDEAFQGKEEFEDGLTQFLPDGKTGFRIQGLNTCQTVGSNHQVAVDRTRGWVWITESVAKRVRKFDRHGKELMKLDGVRASALAVDEATGNAWALLSGGTIYGGSVVVLDPLGNALARHNAAGFDIAYDARDKAFWVVGKNVTKLAAVDGRILVEKPIAAWCAVSVACDPRSGQAWVAVRQHPEVEGSINELILLDKNGDDIRVVPLKEEAPFKVCADGLTGGAWVVVAGRAMLRLSHSGEVHLRHEADVRTAEVDAATGELWVVTPDEVRRLSPEAKVLETMKLPRRTEQSWCAWF